MYTDANFSREATGQQDNGPMWAIAEPLTRTSVLRNSIPYFCMRTAMKSAQMRLGYDTCEYNSVRIVALAFRWLLFYVGDLGSL